MGIKGDKYRSISRHRALRLGLACGACVALLGAAGPAPNPFQPQLADASLPTPPAPPHTAIDPASLQPAPVPDQDAPGPPRDLRARTAELAPKLLSEKNEFAGEAYGRGSSVDEATDQRKRPAAGLNFSAPLE